MKQQRSEVLTWLFGYTFSKFDVVDGCDRSAFCLKFLWFRVETPRASARSAEASHVRSSEARTNVGRNEYIKIQFCEKWCPKLMQCTYTICNMALFFFVFWCPNVMQMRQKIDIGTFGTSGLHSNFRSLLGITNRLWTPILFLWVKAFDKATKASFVKLSSERW